MNRRFYLVVLALMGLVGCVSRETSGSGGGGPAYVQQDLGSPGRQTDFFGNGLRP
ncbi:hypothetical protein AB4Z40_35190 [Bosea sp. 2YAB26]|uniref:hypothetical protein n=1 Tax=Bosea sp. 2YAB26 TaxID=3237478 RepID=UPI003F9135DD